MKSNGHSNAKVNTGTHKPPVGRLLEIVGWLAAVSLLAFASYAVFA